MFSQEKNVKVTSQHIPPQDWKEKILFLVDPFATFSQLFTLAFTKKQTCRLQYDDPVSSTMTVPRKATAVHNSTKKQHYASFIWSPLKPTSEYNYKNKEIFPQFIPFVTNL